MKNCILRGKILRLLSEVYPEGLERINLIGIYYQFDKVDDIEKSLAYLCDKKYILKKVYPHPCKENEQLVSYKILPLGIDLIEGSIEKDPGVVIPTEA
jgi:hypothetical protein